MTFKKRHIVFQLNKGVENMPLKNLFKNAPDKRVIVHHHEPLGVWLRAAEKPLKDGECLPAVACK